MPSVPLDPYQRQLILQWCSQHDDGLLAELLKNPPPPYASNFGLRAAQSDGTAVQLPMADGTFATVNLPPSGDPIMSGFAWLDQVRFESSDEEDDENLRNDMLAYERRKERNALRSARRRSRRMQHSALRHMLENRTEADRRDSAIWNGEILPDVPSNSASTSATSSSYVPRQDRRISIRMHF